jgi:FtsH-binding integral membrane protein
MTTLNKSYTAGSDTISANMYNFIIGAVLLYGFAINWYIVATVPVETVKALGWMLLVGYFVSCIIGSIMIHASSNPLVSFIGYNFIAVPLGIVLTLILDGVSPEVVSNAIQTTALVTVGMIAAGTLAPNFFKSILSGLFWALLIAIVVQLVLMFVFEQHLTILDWAVALIFCGFIGGDWAVAMSLEKTVDNAVDSAANLYLDIINLFIKVLSIMKED